MCLGAVVSFDRNSARWKPARGKNSADGAFSKRVPRRVQPPGSALVTRSSTASTISAEPDYHVVAHAGHLDFLAPCSDAMAHAAAMICQSEPGFSRQAFHAEFNRDAVAFFEANLPKH